MQLFAFFQIFLFSNKSLMLLFNFQTENPSAYMFFCFAFQIVSRKNPEDVQEVTV